MSDAPRDPRLPDAAATRHGRDRERAHSATSVRAQMAGVFLAPAAFFAHLQVAYVLVPWSCASGNHAWIHVSGIASVLLAAAGAALAFTVWTREGSGEPGEHGGPAPRARFLGLTGFVMGAVFVLLLLAQWLAAFVIGPCS